MISVILSTYLYEKSGVTIIFGLLSVLPLIINIPTILYLYDPISIVKPAKIQCKTIFDSVCSRAVWQPMGAIFLFNALSIGNNAVWRQ